MFKKRKKEEENEKFEEFENVENLEPAVVADDEGAATVEVSAEQSDSVPSVLSSRFEAWLADKTFDKETASTCRQIIEMIESAITEESVDESLFEAIGLAADYHRAVAEASAAGEIRGRNARIEEIMAEQQDDGVPHPGSGSGAVETRRPPSIFDLARKAI